MVIKLVNSVYKMERWVGKVAVVTGASSGIGAAIAKLLVEEGLQVAGFARRKERVEELSNTLKNEKGKLYPVKVDITKEDDIIKGFRWVRENLGPIHVLVNNAGVALQNSDLIDGDYEVWKTILDTNVLGLCVATREAIKDMKDNNIDGHIIHINSVAGHRIPNMPGVSVYAPSKFAVTALAETLRNEFNNSKLKIKITSLSPGLVATEIVEPHKEKFIGAPILQSEDIANSVKYVLSTPPHVQIKELTIQPVGETF